MAQARQALINQLSTSCKKMDSGTIRALSDSVEAGELDWFVDEFRAALDGGFTLALWAQITQQKLAGEDTSTAEVSAVWTAVVPNEPFPGMHWS